ncbi:MAG: hypothetical protein EOO43_23880, partial [Flavobacterium sp.]
MPTCRRELVEDESETDDAAIVGDEAHIVAREVDGPRGQSTLTADERDKYNNLVLMCKIHHKVIDDQENTYTVEKLHEIKQKHLDWIAVNLSLDIQKQRDEEIYASYVDRWLELADLENWKAWSSWILSGGQPVILREMYNNLRELNQFLLSRVWPKRYLELEKSFKNFRAVLNDFINVFDKYKKAENNDLDCDFTTEKFYKRLEDWDEVAYREISNKFDYHVDLVQDLMLELTRAANGLSDSIRRDLSPSFRLTEGVLLVEIGPDYSLTYTTKRLESLEEFPSYNGL